MKWCDASKVQPTCDRTVIAEFGIAQTKVKFRYGRWCLRVGMSWVPTKKVPYFWRENNAILKLTGLSK